MQDDVIVKILNYLSLPSRLPVCKPARAPPPRLAGKQVARTPFPVDNGIFDDFDYSDIDYIDEWLMDDNDGQIGAKKTRQAKNLLELVDHFPGNVLCWASDLIKEE